VEANLDDDAGWDAAVQGCQYVLHVASPVPAGPPKHPDELIKPAREGTLRVLRAAAKAGVQRVVLTSSTSAVIYGHARDGSKTYTEEDWSQLGPTVSAYDTSKTLAERAAWEFVNALPAASRLEMVAILPGAVLGPVLDKDFSTSGEIVRKLMTRAFPGCPDLGWAVVDVRDVAALHVAAMTHPDAVGKRFIAAIEHTPMGEIARILSEHFGPRGYKIPTRRLPGWILKVVALWDSAAALTVNELGKRQDVSNARARETFGWIPRTLEQMVIEMGETMIACGAVPSVQRAA
jgi:nucleoside-diphosphate-sugar epimerase